MDFAAGYQHFADGRTFGEIVLDHPSVREVYFPWPTEPSGRPVLGFEEESDPAVLADALANDLTLLRAHGVRLDLLLNANCYGAEAMSKGLEGHVIGILGTLIGWNLKPEIVTVASPFVARTVKRVFPEIEVRASVNMRLMTLQAFRYLSPWFDSYYIGRDVQRNLDTVRRFSDWCRANGKKLCLLANSGCLRNCPWQTYHDNLVAHSAEAMKRTNAKGWSPHLCWTMYKDAANFPEFLKATWIRPEDIRRYEGLVDTVKLATRQHANPGMVISAYERGGYDGNLLDLMEPGFSPAFYPTFVDNAAFPSDWFERSGSCTRECTQCGYCEKVFSRVAKTLKVLSLAVLLAATGAVAGEKVSSAKAQAWAKAPAAMAFTNESASAFAFRHTGVENWAVNVTPRRPAQAGDRLRFRFVSEKTLDASGSFRAGFVVYGAGKDVISWAFEEETLKPGDGYDCTVTLPTGATGYYVRLRGVGQCAARVRDCSVERIGSVFPEGFVIPQEPELAAAAFRDYAGRDVFDGDHGRVAAMKGRSGFLLRYVAADTDYAPVETLPDFRLEVRTSDGVAGEAYDVTLRELTGRDRAVSLVYAVPLEEGPVTWFRTLRESETFASGERQYTVAQGSAGRGRLARWPFGAAAVGGKGVALGIDPEAVAFHRFGANASTRQLYVVFDLGFAKEHPAAHVRFRRFAFDAADGLRGALVAYRAEFPEMFRVRCRKHGLWTVSDSLKDLPGLDDFGFRFRGRMGQIAFDDERDFLTFRYTEPCTWWVTVPGAKNGAAYSFADGVALCEKLAAEPIKPPRSARAQPDATRFAHAWKTSVFHDADGQPQGETCRRSWCAGILWKLNSAPGIGGPDAFNDFRSKLAPELFDARYARPFPEGLDGEYFDSAELYVTPWCDFTRAHFAGMETPLCFDDKTKRPAIYKGMVSYEYFREAARLTHAKGRLTLANCTPITWWFLVPFLDVPGSEVWWVKADGKGWAWRPMDDEDFMFRRAMCGGKPLCFLQDAPFDHFTKEMTEKYFQRSLAYGALPSFFTWHGVSTFGTNIYFSRPDCYERDRPLFRKYVPLCKALSEAGWQCVNRVTASDNAQVITEQFGDGRSAPCYATVFNLSSGSQSVRLAVRAAVASLDELVTGRSVTVSDGILSLTLPPETVRVYRFNSSKSR